MYNVTEIVQRIRETAKEKGFSNARLMQASGLGVNYVKQMNIINLENITKIANALDVSVDFLLYGYEKNPVPEDTEQDDSKMRLYKMLATMNSEDIQKTIDIVKLVAPEKYNKFFNEDE